MGNEVLAWAKSYIAARDLGHEMMKPAWLWNRYQLATSMDWTRTEMIRSEIAARTGRRLHISQAMVAQTGEVDYGRAVKQIVEELPRAGAPRTLIHSGMWGGYVGIASARRFILQQILGVPGVLKSLQGINVDQPLATIGVHVRRGDFIAKSPGPGEFNRGLPAQWFIDLMTEMSSALDGRAQFLLFSDSDLSDLQTTGAGLSLRQVRNVGGRAALMDLTALASCDTVVCSVSSFSMLAAFLADVPYFWYEPQLTNDGGMATLWGRTAPGTSAHPGHDTVGMGPARGIPWESGPIPSWWTDYVRTRASLRSRGNDLIYHGALNPRGGSEG